MGVGKTTLLRSIASDLTLSAGRVTMPPKTAYLRQEAPRLEATDGQTALENALIDSYRGACSDFVRQRADNEAVRAHQAAAIGKEASRLAETKKVFSKGNATHAAERRALQRRIETLNDPASRC